MTATTTDGAAPLVGGPAPRTAPLPLGDETRRHLARVLEQSQTALLRACIETAGGDLTRPWRLTLTGAVLEPEQGPP